MMLPIRQLHKYEITATLAVVISVVQEPGLTETRHKPSHFQKSCCRHFLYAQRNSDEKLVLQGEQVRQFDHLPCSIT